VFPATVTTCEPEQLTAPIPEIEQLVAFVADQVSVTAVLRSTVVELAEIAAVGVPTTVTVACTVAEPPAPVHVSA
jgi:hypothetical protein